MSVRRFAIFCWGVLGYTILVILWGAYVRATGSGAGCGSHWPLCNGEVIPRSAGMETLIEFTHRLTSGLALVAVLVLLVWAYRLYPPGSWVRKGAVLSVVFMLTEALVGAGLVLFGLVTDNDSFLRAWVMAFHLVNTFLLLGALAVTASQASKLFTLRRPGDRETMLLALAGGVGLMLLGASGAVTALGDTLFPARTLAEALQQDFSPGAHFLIRLRIYHPVLGLSVGVLLIWTSRRLGRRSGSALVGRLSQMVVSLVVFQLLLGLVNIWLLAPVWLQMLHLAVSDLIWISFLLMGLSAISGAQETASPRGETRLTSPAKMLSS